MASVKAEEEPDFDEVARSHEEEQAPPEESFVELSYHEDESIASLVRELGDFDIEGGDGGPAAHYYGEGPASRAGSAAGSFGTTSIEDLQNELDGLHSMVSGMEICIHEMREQLDRLTRLVAPLHDMYGSVVLAVSTINGLPETIRQDIVKAVAAGVVAALRQPPA